MANDKKNINELVSDDDDPTAELEVPVFDRVSTNSGADTLFESGANTYDYAEPDAAGHGVSIPELQSDLKDRSETISRLQYDMEQLRARWIGLETEIKAREEQTVQLNNRLDESVQTVAQKDKLLKKRDQALNSLKAEIRARNDEYDSLKASLIEREQRVDELQREIADDSGAAVHNRKLVEQQAGQLATAEVTIKELTSQVARTEAYSDTLRYKLQEQSEIIVEADKARASVQLQLDNAAEQVAKLTLNHAEQEDAYEALGVQLAELHDIHAEEIRTIRFELGEAAETVAQHQHVEEQLTSNLVNLRESRDELEHMVSKTEAENRLLIENLEAENRKLIDQLNEQQAAHAEEIRTIRFELGEAEETVAQHHHVEEQLTSNLENLRESRDELEHIVSKTEAENRLLIENLEAENRLLTENLEAEKRKLIDQLSEQQGAHTEEIRTIRFELGEAEGTIAQQELAAEQLASELMDSRGFKDELEQMFNKSLEDNQGRIENLEKDNRKLLREAEEKDEKLETKSETINCLLAELAKKSEQIDSISEINDVIHDIDNRMSERIDDRAGKEPDRIARLLIGSVDGQELRFPLFKNRLTIGRTEQNDIQLKATYVSRRHAVIVTEHDQARVIDWGSKNGVFVNSRRVNEHFLENGDTISIGTVDFRYEERPIHDV